MFFFKLDKDPSLLAAIAKDDWRLLRDTGVAHLVSISGIHITSIDVATAEVGTL